MQHTKISPRLPPTPKPSTELAPRRTPRLSIDASFNLGPAAITLSPEVLKTASSAHTVAATHQAPPLSPTSPFSLTPINPDEPRVQQRRRTSSSAGTTTSKRKDVVIGPPPTRQHPIIQMKPREVVPAIVEDTTTKAVAGTKRKATGVSAAKRKIARKTAHSEIERRRRSKMNDQFAKLKSMVPACKNQDMHKLAILEATTEYLAYLEEAIKVYRNAGSDSVVHSPPTFSASDSGPGDEMIDYDDEEDDEADDFAIATADCSPALSAIPSHQPTLEITDTEATHALLLLADHQSQHSPRERMMSFSTRSRPISVKDLLL
ncbi:hypothetical protein AOL_s00173g128 [Orbilia oligospora ATCC 24927]|uniref:BHLH domain-containing protein n=1 Tax=Arthrobotrys oligospora (strain ATCC 24927 / CBS 115.81 / DSM 1491) TaxID=756982 RepID=G1XNW0_ARTOA|nr:hypothetical protein AOL_s00173g128 [Orbilia oligospora ATCC 24927]EGX45027.1 hypothetical protein AOL_s00173g128 [Orbilia oligospora ATCC 24927]